MKTLTSYEDLTDEQKAKVDKLIHNSVWGAKCAEMRKTEDYKVIEQKD